MAIVITKMVAIELITQRNFKVLIIIFFLFIFARLYIFYVMVFLCSARFSMTGPKKTREVCLDDAPSPEQAHHPLPYTSKKLKST
jgi:hypothetical protein